MTSLLSALAAYVSLGLDTQEAGPLDRLAARLRTWRERMRARDDLATFDERLLKDIGLTACDVVVERDKFFWQR